MYLWPLIAIWFGIAAYKADRNWLGWILAAVLTTSIVGTIVLNVVLAFSGGYASSHHISLSERVIGEGGADVIMFLLGMFITSRFRGDKYVAKPMTFIKKTIIFLWSSFCLGFAWNFYGYLKLYNFSEAVSLNVGTNMSLDLFMFAAFLISYPVLAWNSISPKGTFIQPFSVATLALMASPPLSYWLLPSLPSGHFGLSAFYIASFMSVFVAVPIVKSVSSFYNRTRRSRLQPVSSPSPESSTPPAEFHPEG